MVHVDPRRFEGHVQAMTPAGGVSDSVKRIAMAAVAVWFVFVFVLGAAGAFVRPAGSPPFPILAAFLAPLLAFGVAYRTSGAFKALVLATDLRLGAAIQSWRVGGLGFVALYAYGVLPGLFALPAGLGDIAIGVTAPWVALALAERPSFAGSRGFVVWNILGLLDLVVAIGTGVLSSGFLGDLTGGVTTAPMAELPLVVVPTFFVPLFVMLHLAALLQARRRSRSEPLERSGGMTERVALG